MLKPTSIFFLQVLLSGLAFSRAFQACPPAVLRKAHLQPTTLPPVHGRFSFETNLQAPKKKEAEKKEAIGDDAMKMFKAYASPFRNPNSIFVYMFLALYVLGKYSESKHGG